MDDKDFICKLYGLKNIFKTVKAEVKAVNNGRLTKNKANSENARAAGNKLYTQKNREQDTLMYYTKSIAYAPEDSEELALGFSNRSALLLHLHYYKECLIDINRALEITKSDQLKAKLQTRKEKCILLNEQSITNKGTKKTDIGCVTSRQLTLADVTSSKIPCAAEFVSIKIHKRHKRQLVATRDIKPGEIVITEKAYACCPESSKIYLICSHCLSFACNGIPCDFCAHVIYCSETCKKEAWEEYHDIECSILHSINAILFTIEIDDQASSNDGLIQNCGIRDIILLGRIFIKAIKTEGLQNILNETELIDSGSLDLFSDGAFESNKFGYIYSLRCRPQNKTSEFLTFSKEMSVLYLLIKRTNLLPVTKKRKELNSSDEKILLRLRDILIKLSSIIDLSGFGYQWYQCPHEDYMECATTCNTNRGAFIAPFSAIINHSCVYNLSRVTVPQPKNIVYASMPIKKGEQLAISYGPSFFTGDAEKRKILLEQLMCYSCDCIACKDEQSFIKDIDKKRGYLNFKKVKSEFKRIFRNHFMDFFFSESDVKKWPEPTEVSLKQALKLIELYHEYYEFREACFLTLPLEYYTTRSFHEFYDGKCPILGYC